MSKKGNPKRHRHGGEPNAIVRQALRKGRHVRLRYTGQAYKEIGGTCIRDDRI